MESHLGLQDPKIFAIIQHEEERQRNGLEMIASENYASPAVREAVGSALTNKYAEGYPGKRYYGGCEEVDAAEREAINRAKDLFGAEHANVQPHDGSGANRAAYRAAGLRASRGKDPQDADRDVLVSFGSGFEHLTHGKKVSATGRDYEVAHFGVLGPENLEIDISEADRVMEKHRGRVKVLMLGHSSYPKRIRSFIFGALADIAHEHGATFVVDMAHVAGLVAGGVHDSPVPHAGIVTSTTHKTLRGPRAGLVLSKAEYAEAVDRAVFPRLQGGPHMHVIAGKAVCFGEALRPGFQEYAQKILRNTRSLKEGLASQGVQALGGDEDGNHLLLVNVAANDGPGGKRVEDALNDARITVNKNALPFDTRKADDPSGIRIGTPAVTTRGMGQHEMKLIAGFIATIVRNPEHIKLKLHIRNMVKELCSCFPVP